MDNEIDPEILSQMLSLGGLSEEEGRLAEQMTGARALKASPMEPGRMIGDVYVAANPLQHALTAMRGMEGRKTEADVTRRLGEISTRRSAARGAMMKALPAEEPDVYSLFAAPDEATAQRKTDALRQAIAQRRQVGTAGMLSGDPALGKVGSELVGEARQGAETLGAAGQYRVKSELEAKRAAEARQHQLEQERHGQALEELATGRLDLQGRRQLVVRDEFGTPTMRSAFSGGGKASSGTATRAPPTGAPGGTTVAPGNASSADSEVDAITRAIIEGRRSPDLKGLFKVRPLIEARLAASGFNQASALSDWNATQRHIAAMNGTKIAGLMSSANTAQESLANIEKLYNEWVQIGPASGLRLFNRAGLRTAQNMPGRAGAVAQALEMNIADLTAELGNVYMGGNSPTDHALKLAAHNLSADWNEEQFREAIKQARQNIGYRINSIKSSPVMGASAGNAYAPPAPVGEGSASPKATHRFNPATGKIEAIQ
jgi:hypothetical protein